MPPPRILAVMLALVTIGVYLPVIGYDFVSYDDSVYVTANEHIQRGLTWDGLRWAFGKPDATLGYWHPVTLLSHMADCQLFGLRPWGHHLTSVLLHALNAVLLFFLLRQLTGDTLKALLVASLFALHPLRVESVAWVAERKDVLSGCFGLLSLICYARYVQAQSLASVIQDPASRFTPHVSRFTFTPASLYLLSLLCFALGLMSKPMLVSWPLVMLLLDYWPLKRSAECGVRSAESRFTFHVSPASLLTVLLEKLPFFALSALASAASLVTQQQAGALSLNESLPLGARAANAVMSYGRYLLKTLWPVDLAVFYPMPAQWPAPTVLLVGAGLLAVTVWLPVSRRRCPWLVTGWLWYGLTLLPVIGLVQVGEFALADRFTYLPSIGVLILVVWGLTTGASLDQPGEHPTSNIQHPTPTAGAARSPSMLGVGCRILDVSKRRSRRSMHAGPASAWAGLALVIACAVLTRQQLRHWENTEALFRHALAVTRENHVAQVGLGIELARKERFDEAIGHYREALRLKPGFALAHNDLGYALLRNGQFDAAIEQYREAIRLKPDYLLAHHNLGNAYYLAGRDDEAIRQYQEALRLKPDNPNAHNDLGIALFRKGRREDAAREFQEALRLDPGHADARTNLEAMRITTPPRP